MKQHSVLQEGDSLWGTWNCSCVLSSSAWHRFKKWIVVLFKQNRKMVQYWNCSDHYLDTMRAPVCIWCSGDVQLVQEVGRAASSCSPRYIPLGTEHISSQKYVRELCWLKQKSHPGETGRGDCLAVLSGESHCVGMEKIRSSTGCLCVSAAQCFRPVRV